MFNLLKATKEQNSLENLQKKYDRKIRHMLLTGEGKIENACEMAYYQLTKGSFISYCKKPIIEAINYFSRGRDYKKAETVFFKDLIEVWSPSADYSSGRINVNKIKHDPENTSSTVLILKLICELQNLNFEYTSEGNSKIGFKCP